MSGTDKELKRCCKNAAKRHKKIAVAQASQSIMAEAPLTLLQLIVLRDIACANRDAWDIECLLLSQQVADFQPPT
jgi:hypothetical protein